MTAAVCFFIKLLITLIAIIHSIYITYTCKLCQFFMAHLHLNKLFAHMRYVVK